jgi:parallel beta-helix repeat protein
MIELPDLSKGGVIKLQAGVYEMTKPVNLTKSLQLSGEGEGVTRIVASPELEGSMLSFSQYGHRLIGFVTIKDLTLEGNRTCGGIYLENVVRSRFDRVETLHCDTGLYCVQVWDSTLTDCVWDRCGVAPTADDPMGKPVVVLADARAWKNYDGTPYLPPTEGGNTNNNNLNFIACAWDNNAGISLWLGKLATKNRFLSCKFHGELPDPVNCSHIELHGAFANVITACNITNGGGTGIVLDKSDGNVITSNLISGQRGGGIKNLGKNNVISGNWEAVFKGDSKRDSR